MIIDQSNSQTWISQSGIFSLHVYLDLKITIYNMFRVEGTPRSSMKYLTGLGQNPAVAISTVYIVTAGFCPNPVKYFTDKKCTSLT